MDASVKSVTQAHWFSSHTLAAKEKLSHCHCQRIRLFTAAGLINNVSVSFISWGRHGESSSPCPPRRAASCPRRVKSTLHILTSAASSSASCLASSHAAYLLSAPSFTDTFPHPFRPACPGLLTSLPQPPQLCTVGPEY